MPRSAIARQPVVRRTHSLWEIFPDETANEAIIAVNRKRAAVKIAGQRAKLSPNRDGDAIAP
jgi:hypothetical protein